MAREIVSCSLPDEFYFLWLGFARRNRVVEGVTPLAHLHADIDVADSAISRFATLSAWRNRSRR
jgi:hypothetical protein